MVEYYVRLKYRSFWGVPADNPQEAEEKGREVLADLILKGVISLEIRELSDEK